MTARAPSPIVDRTPAAAKKLAGRARQRVAGATTPPPTDVDPTRHRQIVGSFLAAARIAEYSVIGDPRRLESLDIAVFPPR